MQRPLQRQLARTHRLRKTYRPPRKALLQLLRKVPLRLLRKALLRLQKKAPPLAVAKGQHCSPRQVLKTAPRFSKNVPRATPMKKAKERLSDPIFGASSTVPKPRLKVLNILMI